MFASACVLPTVALAAQVSPAALRVTIDPGHGGGYSGATYSGTQEADINLAVARLVATELKRRRIDVRLTRSSDRLVYNGGTVYTWRFDEGANVYRYAGWSVVSAEDRLRRDLQSRCDVAHAAGSDLFVSIHSNAAGSSAHGAEVWRAPNDKLGQQFGVDMQQKVVAATSASDRGVHTANFYVVRWTNVPAVLVECGFLSNATERAKLRSPSYQAKLARGIADGIQAFARRPVNETFDRVAGATRYDTAAAVAVRGWPGTAPTVVLASGETYPDALVAAPLAAKLGAPILTTARAGLSTSVKQQLARLSPQRLVIVGGEASVSSAVATEAAAAAGIAVEDIERIGGANRYEVSLAVAQQVASTTTTSVVVVSGTGFADALSIAASAAQRGEPILLAAPSGLSPGARDLITGGHSRAVTVVGGTTSLPNAALGGLPFKRLSGRTRYDTNWAVFTARYAETARRKPVLVSGEVFTDALVAGPLAAKSGRPVLLVGHATVSPSLRPWVYGNRNAVLDVDVVGGPASVTAYVSAMFDKMEMRSY